MTIPDNSITHLVHSSNLLKLHGRVILVDYPEAADAPGPGDGLQNGVIDPRQLAGETVSVFVSHAHGDHFHRDIFTWSRHIRDLTYILSYDVPDPPAGAVVMRPGDTAEVEDIRVRAYDSTDAGVAFSLYSHDTHVYFSGDNAFWNWDGDLDDDIYLRLALSQIDDSRPIDIAFQVCDPRLDGMGDGGVLIFAGQFRPRLLVPIHSFGNYAFNAVVEKRLRKAGFKNDFWCVAGRGDRCFFRNPPRS